MKEGGRERSRTGSRAGARANPAHRLLPLPLPLLRPLRRSLTCTGGEIKDGCSDDPSAGSPTETLLRLLLPLNDQV